MLMMLTSDSSELTGSPILVWFGIVVSVTVAVATAAPKVLGPLGEAWAAWAEQKRERANMLDNEDIRERDRIIAYQKGVIAEQRWEIQERNRLIAEHEPFDHEMLSGRVPPYGKPIPPLYPTPRPIPTAEAIKEENDG